MSNITYKAMVTFDNDWGVYGYLALDTGLFHCVNCAQHNGPALITSQINSDTCWAIDDGDGENEGLQELECYTCSKVVCVAFVPFTRPRSVFENLPDLDLLNHAMRLLVEAGRATIEWTYIDTSEEIA